MPKKIYDIKPPKVAKKSAKDIKEFLDGEKKKVPQKRVVRKTKPVETVVQTQIVKETPVVKREYVREEKKSFAKIFAITALVVVLLVCGFLYVKLPKADVKIWPKVDTLSFQQKIAADKTVSLVDVEKNVIPAQYFEVSKDGSEDFLATGNADNTGKATGTITVLNKYIPASPVTLKAGTHFMSDSGKLFITLEKIVVPAAKKSGSKITAGSIQVKVQAVEGGDSYNIAPSNFSIPGLKGTNYYFNVNATSSTAMTGGYSGKVKKVTDDDIQTAKDVMLKRYTEEAKANLKSQISSDFILLDNAISTTTVNSSSATKVGTVIEKFTYSVKIKASALAFKKSDIEDYAKKYIASQMPKEKTLLDGSLTTDYSAIKVDISGGKADMNFNFSSGVYQNVDKNSLTMSLFGENEPQIKNTISSTLGENVTKTEVNFWPFWVKKAPKSQKSVNIFLEFK